MGANPVDLGAVNAMGAQFKYNVFDKPAKAFMRLATAKRVPKSNIPPRPTTAPTNMRPGLPSGTPKPAGAPRTARPHGMQPKTPISGNPAVAALPAGGQPTTTYAMAPKRAALTAAPRRVLTTPYSPPPRTFAMGGGSTGGSVAHVQNQSQFANVAPRANDPFPTHQHPEGSSNLKLQNLTADQPRQNEFTVGSRNAKPGGIAARGSQLEAWAISKQKATQARQESRKAGGRDRNLSAAAKAAENFANQPLKNFAPPTQSTSPAPEQSSKKKPTASERMFFHRPELS